MESFSFVGVAVALLIVAAVTAFFLCEFFTCLIGLGLLPLFDI